MVHLRKKIEHLIENLELGTPRSAIDLELQTIDPALKASRANGQLKASSLDPKLPNHRSNKLQELP